MNSYHVVLKFPDCAMTSTKIKFRDRSLTYLTMYIASTNERLWMTEIRNVKKVSTTLTTMGRYSRLAVNWPTCGPLGSISEVPLFTSDSYGSMANNTHT